MSDRINQLFNGRFLDLRESKYRFTDQKVTPDVVAFIADCVINLDRTKQESFSKNDVWRSDYFGKNVSFIYNKPDADNVTTNSEYDKFCAQPLKALAYAGVLSERKVSGSNIYTVIDKDILEYISLNDRNAFTFLYAYLDKVMKDSGFFPKIQTYLSACKTGTAGADEFGDLKNAFEKFILGNTNINTVVEIRRIFPKVINIFAVAAGVPGSKAGRMSEGRFPYSDLMYNATNFRDLKKLKNISRQEASKVIQIVDDYNKYEERKAMQAVRNRHSPNSEVRDSASMGEATQVHHIFPRSGYPKLRSTLENLILLTATQHNSKAHPSNKTQLIDRQYQIECLLAKCDSVQKSVIADDGFYSKEGLVSVLNGGFELNLTPELSFDAIKQRITALR